MTDVTFVFPDHLRAKHVELIALIFNGEATIWTKSDVKENQVDEILNALPKGVKSVWCIFPNLTAHYITRK